MTDLAVLYEHPAWFEPLWAALDRHGVAYDRISITDHVFDPGGSPPPAPVIFSRVAMSSFLREPEHPIFYARSLFSHWERAGARVVNGTPTLAIDTSKAEQVSLIRSLGLHAPETRAVHRAKDLAKAARGLRFPVLVKADIGGAGAGIARYDTPEDLAAAAEAGTTPVGVNGVSLVQEYAPRRGDKITRVEVLEGRALYALDVFSGGDAFDLCPADACLAQPGKAAVRMARAEAPPEAVAGAEAILRAAGVDVGGVEYLIDDRDGRILFYDVNGLSNFVANPVEVLGFDPHDQLVDFLKREIATSRRAAA